MFTSLAGRVVVVTGGSRGIGKGIARVFARAHANVLIAARDEAGLAAAAEDLAKEGDGEVATVSIDVSRVEDCRRMAAFATQRFGGVDVLCANAGILPNTPLEDMTEQDIDDVLGCNLKGTIFAVQACLPALAAGGRGRVVITSSITGPIPVSRLVALWGQQVRPTGFSADCRDRTSAQAGHHQSRHARQHPHRGARRAGR